MNNCDIERLVEYCEKNIDLDNAKLGDEYFYQSLPLCVIDSVYSIGVRYESAKKAVNNYCNYFRTQKSRLNREGIPPIKEQESIETFLQRMNSLGTGKLTDEIFRNRQRTSAINGILKSEGVLKFTTVLNKYQVNYFQDISKIILDYNFEEEIKQIPGQRSGISLIYFFMLAGSNDLIKPDRTILIFLEQVLKRRVSQQEAQSLLLSVNDKLEIKHPLITPRLLDHEIWKIWKNKRSL